MPSGVDGPNSGDLSFSPLTHNTPMDGDTGLPSFGPPTQKFPARGAPLASLTGVRPARIATLYARGTARLPLAQGLNRAVHGMAAELRRRRGDGRVHSWLTLLVAQTISRTLCSRTASMSIRG